MKQCRYIVPGITGGNSVARRLFWRLRRTRSERKQCGKPATHVITHLGGPLEHETLCMSHAKAWDRLLGTTERLPTTRIK